MKPFFITISIVCLVSLPFYFSCNDESNYVSPISQNPGIYKIDSSGILSDISSAPCCNEHRPSEWSPCGPGGGPWSYKCELEIEYMISCDCCEALWVRFGATPEGDLNFSECYPNQWEICSDINKGEN